MNLNFSNQNLQSQSFRGQNLSGANFCGSDIRGADFTNALLKKANFHHAIAGLTVRGTYILLAAILILSLLSGATTGNASIILSRLLDPVYIEKYTIATAIITYSSLTILCSLVIRKGLGIELAAITGILTAIQAGVTWVLLSMTMGLRGLSVSSRTGWQLIGIVAWAFAGFILGTIAISCIDVLVPVRGVGSKSVNESNRKLSIYKASIHKAIIYKAAIYIMWLLGLGLNLYFSYKLRLPSVNWLTIIFFLNAGVLGTIYIYIARCVSRGDKRFDIIRKMSAALTCISGTSFRDADLTDADLSQAVIQSSDFRNANLTRTNFHLSKYLDFTRFGGTILVDSQVRNLLVTKQGRNKSFLRCNLQGANLDYADLQDADLTLADISKATLKKACLERVNFTQTQALQTNLKAAQLTAACLEGWNIDSTTNLQDIVCDYVFLLNSQQERRPSSGSFAQGEFTKVFNVVLNTVDLIFRDGLDLQALSIAISKLQNQDIGFDSGHDLKVKGIENKDDGVIVIKVEVPPNSNKAQIDTQIHQHYQSVLKILEDNHKAQIASKDQQIAVYRQQQTDLQTLQQMLLPTISEKPDSVSTNKLVAIALGDGDINTGFSVTLRIGKEGIYPTCEFRASLPPAVNITTIDGHVKSLIEIYHQWQLSYRKSLGNTLRLDIPDAQITNVGKKEFFEECEVLADIVKKELNKWLDAATFRPIKEKLLEQLHPSDTARVIVQTNNTDILKLPFGLWNLLDRYPNLEIALGTPVYECNYRVISPKHKVKILAILGNSQGIDLRQDRILLEALPNADITFLVEPQRKQLNEELWGQSWDILFFAGHSSTQTDTNTGRIYINSQESLTIEQLKHALKAAIARGLQIAIFNSCDGLGLALSLNQLQLPQMIVMREPVPDIVAQEFLKNFLVKFSGGETLYNSVRQSREKLQGLESDFPCANWLPVIFQNPACTPPTWKSFLKR